MMYHHAVGFLTDGKLVTLKRIAPREGLNESITGELGTMRANAGEVSHWNFYSMFPGTSENVKEVEAFGFLKSKEHKVLTNYKVDADSHDEETAIGKAS